MLLVLILSFLEEDVSSEEVMAESGSDYDEEEDGEETEEGTELEEETDEE